MELETTTTKPTEGNINLMISIEEVEQILEGMKQVDERVGYLVKLNEYSYRLPNPRAKEKLDSKIFTSEKEKLNKLLTAPCGLYNSLTTSRSITTKTKFRIELKLEGSTWEMT